MLDNTFWVIPEVQVCKEQHHDSTIQYVRNNMLLTAQVSLNIYVYIKMLLAYLNNTYEDGTVKFFGLDRIHSSQSVSMF
jgi:hypothetical protein